MNPVSLIKWGLKAIGGLALNIALLTVWVDVVGLNEALAIIPNFVLISTLGYTVTNRWIWPDGVSPTTLQGHAKQWAGMQTANLVGKSANYGIYFLLLGVVQYQVAWILGAVCTFTVTFVANQRWWTRQSKARATD